MTDEVDALRTAIRLLTQRTHHIRFAFGEPPSPQGEGCAGWLPLEGKLSPEG